MVTSGQSVLVIAAHPDDEVLGCGGAIVRHIEEGDAVRVLIMGEGVSSRTGIPADEVKKEQETLRSHMTRAHEVLGVTQHSQLTLPDQEFDTIPLLEVAQAIEAVIKECEPTLVYTHHAGDVNLDHMIVSRAVEAAVRPLAQSSIREVRTFEVASSTEWNFVREPFQPNVFVALTEKQLEKKIGALRAYTSEIRDFPHPRSSEYLEALARVRGGQSGSRAAEAFALSYRRV